MVARLKEKGYEIVAYDPDETARKKTEELGVQTVDSLAGLVAALPAPRLVWSMIPPQFIDPTLEEILPLLSQGDLFVEAANSQYELTMRRANETLAKGIHFMDVGVSGGPGGARNGACLMIGGDRKDFEQHQALMKDIAKDDGYYAYFGEHGAGHFAKMIHNGIEYGMMQAIGEGAALLKNSPFHYNLVDVFDLYNHGSVIESHLVEWTRDGLKKYGEELSDISPTIGHTGEGEWTANEAHRQGISAPIIEGSFQYRVQSAQNPTYIGRVVNLQRHMFGGHHVAK